MKWIVAISALSLAISPADGDMTIDAGQLFDVNRGEILTQQRITLRADRIVAIGPRTPADATADLDLSGYAVMPGWIDAHTHLIGEIQQADVLAPLHTSREQEWNVARRNALATLQAGFTTVRDVGTYRGLLDVALRDAIARHDVIGPRLFVAGAYITRRGGGGEVIGGEQANQLPAEFRLGVADNENELRMRVQQLAHVGVDFLKVIATGAVLTTGTEPGESEYSYEQLRALVHEAQRFKLDVTAHAHGAEGIKNAIRAGVRSIEHASLIDDEGIALAKQYGTYLVMDIYNGDYIDYVGHREQWSADILRKNTETTQAQRDAFRNAVRAGISIVYGTDSGVYPHGLNARQFALMQQYGMTTMQAVQAATIVAAQLLRQEKQIGSIDVGKIADLVALPLTADAAQPNFSATPIVVQSGQRVLEGTIRANTHQKAQ